MSQILLAASMEYIGILAGEKIVISLRHTDSPLPDPEIDAVPVKGYYLYKGHKRMVQGYFSDSQRLFLEGPYGIFFLHILRVSPDENEVLSGTYSSVDGHDYTITLQREK